MGPAHAAANELLSLSKLITMRVVLLGAPGAGKGTQSRLICQILSIPPISTGDILRQEMRQGSILGNQVKDLVTNGVLVPDEIVIKIVNERIRQEDCACGFLLDGFPRTLSQATALGEAKVRVDLVINIVVNESLLMERICKRRIHPPSGRVYHLLYNPPKQENLDDITHEPLVHRKDDREEAVVQRLTFYAKNNRELVNFYKRLKENGICQYCEVDGSSDIHQVSTLVSQLLASAERQDVPVFKTLRRIRPDAGTSCVVQAPDAKTSRLSAGTAGK